MSKKHPSPRKPLKPLRSESKLKKLPKILPDDWTVHPETKEANTSPAYRQVSDFVRGILQECEGYDHADIGKIVTTRLFYQFGMRPSRGVQ